MCGRFTLDAGSDELARHFNLDQPPNLARRFNIAPTTLVAVVAAHNDKDKRGLTLLKWGLIPENAPDDKRPLINARAESIDWKPSFSAAFVERRCIIPSTGLYEWAAVGKKKQPHLIRLKGGGLMGFAGLWSRWVSSDGRRVFSCAIITTTANAIVSPFHDRMPVILRPEDYDKWLDFDAAPHELRALLKPYPAELMEQWEVAPLVNKAGVEGPELVKPLAVAS